MVCNPGYDLSPCPIGWVHLGDDLCESPPLYDGGCLNLVRMWDIDFKRDFGSAQFTYLARKHLRSSVILLAVRCGVQWPCENKCSEDFGLAPCLQLPFHASTYSVPSRACPDGWALFDKVCIAPALGYTGQVNCDHAYYYVLWRLFGVGPCPPFVNLVDMNLTVKSGWAVTVLTCIWFSLVLHAFATRPCARLISLAWNRNLEMLLVVWL